MTINIPRVMQDNDGRAWIQAANTESFNEPTATEFEARAALQNIVMNGFGEPIENFNWEKMLANLFKMNGRSWDIEKLSPFLLEEIIDAHRN